MQFDAAVKWPSWLSRIQPRHPAQLSNLPHAFADLLDIGKDPGTFTARDFDAAIVRLQKAVDKGWIRRLTGNDCTSDLSSGDLAACVAGAGDVVLLRGDNPDIPNKARHKTNTERLIDHGPTSSPS